MIQNCLALTDVDYMNIVNLYMVQFIIHWYWILGASSLTLCFVCICLKALYLF